MAKTTKRKRVPAGKATAVELARIDDQRRLRAAVRREQDIQRSARRLERLTQRTDIMLIELARSVVGPDFAVVPATSERAQGPE